MENFESEINEQLKIIERFERNYENSSIQKKPEDPKNLLCPNIIQNAFFTTLGWFGSAFANFFQIDRENRN